MESKCESRVDVISFWGGRKEKKKRLSIHARRLKKGGGQESREETALQETFTSCLLLGPESADNRLHWRHQAFTAIRSEGS